MIGFVVVTVLALTLAGLVMLFGVWLAVLMLGEAPYDLRISLIHGVMVLPHGRPERLLGRGELKALRKLRARIDRGEVER